MKQLQLEWSPRPGWLRRIRLKPRLKQLLTFLGERSIDGGSVSIAQEMLAAEIGVSVRTLRRLSERLVELDLLLRLGPGGSRYVVRWAELGDRVALQEHAGAFTGGGSDSVIMLETEGGEA